MIVLFTDFGANDIYTAQVEGRLHAIAPQHPVIVTALHSVPDYEPRSAAHLLAALHRQFGSETVFLAVVDPGVGSERAAVVMQADGQWFVGPDNGLLSVIAARAERAAFWRIRVPEQGISASFHGRDLFAPIAAQIATGVLSPSVLDHVDRLDVELGGGDLAEVIFIDHFGNAITGLRAVDIPHESAIEVAGRRVEWARVFSDIERGTPCWYENSLGLVEIAVNCGRASDELGLAPGHAIRLIGGHG